MHVNHWKYLTGHNVRRLALAFILFVLLLAFVAPYISTYNPVKTSTEIHLSPSWDHLLGTNDVGQDNFSRLLYGARTSLLVGLGVALLSTFISLVLGIIAGMKQGMTEQSIMRMADVLLVLPDIFLIILVGAYLQPSVGLLILLISLLSWPMGGRLVRAETLVLNKSEHINMARCFGAGSYYIAWRHIIPDLGPIMAAYFIQAMRRAIFLEAGLAFLGLTDPASISWGTMMNHALKYIYLDAWRWSLLPPGIMLSLLVVSLSLFSQALEESMQPLLRRQ